ncbi:MAG: hypothetical protein ACI4AH_04495 [Muribaculaceae bacterium]
MENKKFNHFRMAAIFFAIGGACFIISSMMDGGSNHMPLGMVLVVLGMVCAGLAHRLDKKQEKDDKED